MSPGFLLALASAFVWGSGDFCGGRAATRSHPFQVLALAALSGITLLIVSSLLAGEPIRFDQGLWWAAAAGVAGSGGIVALYQGLAVSSAATVAPLAAVIAAIVPVVFGSTIEGLPRMVQMIGFGVATVGIWLVTRAASSQAGSREGVRLGALAGVGFGGFLVLIALVPPGAVFVPLAVARTVMLMTALVALASRRLSFPALASNPLGLLAGALDAGGNVLYLLARQSIRLDVAAVLSSLYPVSTVLLARVITHERITPTQWWGAAVCLVAVALIAA